MMPTKTTPSLQFTVKDKNCHKKKKKKKKKGSLHQHKESQVWFVCSRIIFPKIAAPPLKREQSPRM